jgi:trigger factor
MRATATPTENNQVQILIEVEEPEMLEAINETAKRLSREISVKGFRKGKAPRQVIEARIGGHEALRAEAIRSTIPDFYAKGVSEAGIEPIDQPQVNVTSGEDEGELTLEVTVGVRPEVFLFGHRDLKVTIPSPLVTDDEIDAQITRIRQSDAELREIDRPFIEGDIIIADVKAQDTLGDSKPIDLDDYSYEIGSAGLAEGLDEALVGRNIGDTVEAVGRRAANEFMKFTVTVKQARERILPELTDEWVSDNTEYESVDALSDGIGRQLRRMKLVEAQMARRDSMLSALSDLVDADLAPESLVNGEIQQRLNELSQRLEQRGINFDYFMQITGQSPEELMAQLRGDALRAVRVDLALRALAKAEELAPSDDEITQELIETAGPMEVTPEELRATLYERGRTVAFAAEVAKMKASKWLMEHAIYLDENGAEIDRELLETDHSEPVNE